MNANTELWGSVGAGHAFWIDLLDSGNLGGWNSGLRGGLRRKREQAEGENDAEHHSDELLKVFHDVLLSLVQDVVVADRTCCG